MCIRATTSTIPSSASSSAWITTSIPSPSTFSSASVTRAAISIRRSERKSRPVISQSIHTNSSRTALNSKPRRPSSLRCHDGADRHPAQQIAAGYATTGQALELGAVLVGGQVDSSAQVRIPLAMMNRHGLVAGATGTGKTKTLQLIAEQLSAAGVPVVMADFKGDLSGLSGRGGREKVLERAGETGDDWTATPYPVEFLSLGTGGIGVPVRATISAFGPILLSKVLGLNQNQESTLGLIFHYADQRGLPLLDLKDLRSVITFLTTTDEGKAQLKTLGAVSTQTAGVILRALVNLEAEGGDTFFGEPELQPDDLLRVDANGRGVISLFEVGDQAARPVMFSTFLMWVLADLFNYLPEVGDVDKPKLVFFFDEAHLLFKDASKAFLNQVEQTVKLIRSKGSGFSALSCPPTSPTRCCPNSAPGSSTRCARSP